MTDINSIKVALSGFFDKDELTMRNYFSKSQYWSKPWCVVDSINDAQAVLLAYDGYNDFIDGREQDKAIIYFAEENSQNHDWFLKKLPDGSFSLLEFSQLLIKLGYFIADNKSITPVMLETIDQAKNQISGFDDTQDIENFLDKITFLLDSGKIQKTKFNAN